MSKLKGLQAALPEDVGAALIISPVNRRYYTKFPSSAGTLIVMREQACLIIDSRYFEAARASIRDCEVILQDKLYAQIGELLQKHHIKTAAVEGDSTSLNTFSTWKEKLPQVTLLGDSRLSGIINKQRRIKDAEEISLIQQAQDLADKTFMHILDFIRPGKTEREIALEMEFYSRLNGSEEAAFAFIVVSGKNSSLPHGVPSDKSVEPGDLITMDFGATVKGYRSDMTRTVAVGQVSGEQREVYETVLKAQLAALDAIKAGVVGCDIDKIARDIIADAGHNEHFGHGLGHSLGLDVHEDPRFAPSDSSVIEAGTCMSVEPGIYIPGKFGVRIEDIVVVQDRGHANFCHSPKELICL